MNPQSSHSSIWPLRGLASARPRPVARPADAVWCKPMWRRRDYWSLTAKKTRPARCQDSPYCAIIISTTSMPNTARSDTLRGAALVLGGADPLADALGVSRLQIDRWLSGEESVPVDVFLLAVDLIEQHDRRKQPRPPGNDTQPGQG
jgi:hypothetical protein